MNAWFSSLSVLKLWLHILSICWLSIPLIVFSIVFSVASEWLSWYFPLSFEHKLLFNTEKKFSTGAYWGEYWGRKKIASNLFCIVSIDCFAVCELALSIMTITLLFLILHFESINLSKSIKYSQNFNEVIVVFSR